MNALVELCRSALHDAPRDVSFLSSPYKGLPIVNGTFFHPRLQTSINKNMKQQYVENVFLRNKKVRITFITGNNVPKYRIKFVFFYTKYILTLLDKINPIPSDVDIFLIDLRNKKCLPRNYLKALTQLNVNSGVTMKYNSNATPAEVYVYRREEMFKVLVHELVHFFDIDFKAFTPSQEDKLATYFAVQDTSIKINECFTDTMACLVNVIIYCMFRNRGVVSDKRFQELIKVHLEEERTHMFRQAVKVLDQGGYVFKKWGLMSRVAHKEYTHVISYYVLKACMFHDIEPFLQYLHENDYHVQSPDDFVALLENKILHNSTGFWKTLVSIRQKFPSSDKGLRMSIIDIDDILFSQKTKLLKTLYTV
jgi:hypothetical protein